MSQNPVHIVINCKSGTFLRLGADTVEQNIRKALGAAVASYHCVEPDKIATTLKTLDQADQNGRPRDVLVGGGDGSAVCAAETIGFSGRKFGMLPLGTMNLLAQDLGAAASFEETMARFERLEEDRIDLGRVNDRLFLCSAVLGVVPESAKAREDLRDEGSLDALSRFLQTITRGMSGEDAQHLKLRSDCHSAPHAIDCTSLIISNNRFTQSPTNWSQRFLRDTLHDGKLAVYAAAPSSMMEGLRLMVKMLQGTWLEDETIQSFETPSLIVETQEENPWLSLDGEPLRMTSPLYFRIEPRALPVLRLQLRQASKQASQGASVA